jgi:para-aminobenzoate synthetase component 1
MSADAYEAAVAKVIAKIAAGEIFQANIARGWQGRLASGTHPLDLLQRLHVQSPAPFAGYMAFGDLALVSNSPERFLQIQPGNPRLIEARPIKGTIGRGRDEVEDQGQIEALTQSAKDRAENLMIVDLMRNDLARICRPGSVAVPSLFAIETFANLHHLVSTVVGEVLPGLGVGAVLRATYPPGSITGAPKVQAMRVIAGIEPPRGPYCGSLFWAGYDGGLDSSVLIRTTAFVRDAGGWAFQTHAGAGIVADSDPVSERRETQTKISAIALALSGVLA